MIARICTECEWVIFSHLLLLLLHYCLIVFFPSTNMCVFVCSSLHCCAMHIFMCMQIEELYERLSSERVQALSWNSGFCFFFVDFQLHVERKQKATKEKHFVKVLQQYTVESGGRVWKACVCANSYLLMHPRYTHAHNYYTFVRFRSYKNVFSFA